MEPGKLFVVISYDISNDKNRLKIMKALQDFGKRVQFSVFECVLRPKELQALQGRLNCFVGQQDSIRYYFLCYDDVRKVQIQGTGGITRDHMMYMY